jgi:hypothetical protein
VLKGDVLRIGLEMGLDRVGLTRWSKPGSIAGDLLQPVMMTG